MKIDRDKIKVKESKSLEIISESKWQWLLNNIKGSMFLYKNQNIKQKEIGDYDEFKYS
jgi:hypothetical protein